MPASNRVFSTKDPVRLGIWGLGRGSHVVATATTVGFEVVAGCDNNPRFLELFRQRVPEGRHTTDAAEFLSWDFDAVLVATFCSDHAAHSIAALHSFRARDLKSCWLTTDDIRIPAIKTYLDLLACAR